MLTAIRFAYECEYEAERYFLSSVALSASIRQARI